MNKKALKLVPLILVLAISMGACASSEGVKQNIAPEKIDDSETQEIQTNQKFKIGDKIALGDYTLTVATIENPYVEKNEYSQPESGYKFIAVEVVYENMTNDKSLSYNPYDWKLYDGDGYTYDQSFMASKDPRLSSGTLNAGGKVRGWLSFEVPENSTNYKIQFTPSWLSYDNVEIELF